VKKQLSLAVILILLLTGCSVPTWISDQITNPKSVLEDAILNMSSVETIRTQGETSLEGNILGNAYVYRISNGAQVKLKDGNTVEAYMDTTFTGKGIQTFSERIYFSETHYGTYDGNLQQWNINEFYPEDQFLVQLFLASFDPNNSINKYYESKVKKNVEIIGREEKNGVYCLGLAVSVNADEMLKEVSPIFKAFVGSTGTLASSITGNLVKNMELIYWVGVDDNLIHGIDTKLPTPIGDYNSTVIIYDHNAPFVLPK
jgi:hypothetical protein